MSLFFLWKLDYLSPWIKLAITILLILHYINGL